MASFQNRDSLIPQKSGSIQEYSTFFSDLQTSNMLRNDRWTGFLWFAVHFSASALWLWMHIEAISGADLLGEWKWMWKLNHVLNCTTEQRSLLGSHTGEMGGGQRLGKKKKASIVSVYPLHCSYIQHGLLVDWQKAELAIKMVIFSPPPPILF